MRAQPSRSQFLVALTLALTCCLPDKDTTAPSVNKPQVGYYSLTLTDTTGVQSSGKLAISQLNADDYVVWITSSSITVQPELLGPPWLVSAKVEPSATDISLELTWQGAEGVGTPVSCIALYPGTLNRYGICSAIYLGL